MPSPEQGASTSTLSKYSGQRLHKSSGRAHTAAAFATPIRSRLRLNTCARLITGSLQTSTPPPAMNAASWVLFPPGAAHKSSTRSPGRGRRREAGAMALGSCK